MPEATGTETSPANAAAASLAAGIATEQQTNSQGTQPNGAGEAAAASAAAAGAQGTQANGAGEPAAKPYWPEDWRQKLAEHAGAGDKRVIEKELKRLERISDPFALYGSYRGIENTWATKGFVKKLGENPSEEDIKTFRQEMGIPDKPEDYLQDIKLDNGAILGEQDKPLASAFAAAMHQAGIPKAGYQAALNWYFKHQEDAAAAADEADEQYKAQANQALREEWGPRFKRMVNGIGTLFNSAPGGADVSNANSLYARLIGGRTADGKMIGNDPDIMRWLASLATEVNPMASVVEDGAGGVKAGEDRLRELRALRQTDSKRYYSDEIQNEERAIYAALEKAKSRS